MFKIVFGSNLATNMYAYNGIVEFFHDALSETALFSLEYKIGTGKIKNISYRPDPSKPETFGGYKLKSIKHTNSLRFLLDLAFGKLNPNNIKACEAQIRKKIGTEMRKQIHERFDKEDA